MAESHVAARYYSEHRDAPAFRSIRVGLRLGRLTYNVRSDDLHYYAANVMHRFREYHGNSRFIIAVILRPFCIIETVIYLVNLPERIDKH